MCIVLDTFKNTPKYRFYVNIRFFREIVSGRYMISRKILYIFCAGIVLVFFASIPTAESIQNDFLKHLADYGGLAEEIFSGIKNDVIVEEAPVGNPAREIAIIAVLRMGVPKTFLMKQLHVSGVILLNNNAKRFGVFGNPPNSQDMIRFQFPKSDLDVMPGCKIGDCKIKLPGRAIQALEEFDWSNKNSSEKINMHFRQGITAYAERYLKRGHTGLLTYADKKEPQPLTSAFKTIFSQFSYIHAYAPEFYRYLNHFPEDTLENTESYLYWSLDEFGLRPVTEITHVMIYHSPSLKATLLAGKQIYASHYFGARFKFCVVISDNEGTDTPGVFLIWLDHSLFDQKLGRVNRSFLSRTARKDVQARLRSMRSLLEAKFRTKEKKVN